MAVLTARQFALRHIIVAQRVIAQFLGRAGDRVGADVVGAFVEALPAALTEVFGFEVVIGGDLRGDRRIRVRLLRIVHDPRGIAARHHAAVIVDRARSGRIAVGVGHDVVKRSGELGDRPFVLDLKAADAAAVLQREDAGLQHELCAGERAAERPVKVQDVLAAVGRGRLDRKSAALEADGGERVFSGVDQRVVADKVQVLHERVLALKGDDGAGELQRSERLAPAAADDDGGVRDHALAFVNALAAEIDDRAVDRAVEAQVALNADRGTKHLRLCFIAEGPGHGDRMAGDGGKLIDDQLRRPGNEQLRRGRLPPVHSVVFLLLFGEVLRAGLGGARVSGQLYDGLQQQRSIVRQPERYALGDHAVLVQHAGHGLVDQLVIAERVDHIALVVRDLLRALEEDRHAAALVVVDRGVGLQIELLPLGELKTVDEKDAAADEVEIAVDDERADAVEPGVPDRQIAPGRADDLRAAVEALEVNEAAVRVVAPALAARRLREVELLIADHEQGFRLLRAAVGGCVERGLSGADGHDLFNGRKLSGLVVLTVGPGGLVPGLDGIVPGLGGIAVKVGGIVPGLGRRFTRLRGRVLHNLHGRLERELLLVAVGPDPAVERDGEQRRAQRAADSFAFLIHRFSVLSFKGDAGAAEAYPLSAICSSSAS